MRKFKGNRPLDTLIEMAENQGWEVDTVYFDKGGDFIWLRDLYGKVESNDGFPRQVGINVTNGYFVVYEPLLNTPVATYMSKDLDNEEWYIAILNLIYEPLEKEL